jgi:hypothetical protein
MKKCFLFLILCAATFAQQKLVVYVDKMDGLESSIEKALQDAEMPFEFIEEGKQPELKVKLAKQHAGAYAEILYKKSTGRNEDHRLELIEVKSGKTLAWYGFKLDQSEAGKARIAREFAASVKSKVKAPKAK